MHVMSNSAILCIELQFRCLNSHVFQLQSQRALDEGRVLPEVTHSACKFRFPLWTLARYTHDQGKYRSLHLKASVHNLIEPDRSRSETLRDIWPSLDWNMAVPVLWTGHKGTNTYVYIQGASLRESPWTLSYANWIHFIVTSHYL